ncbi:hypothetical protein B188_03650 [Candidatus Brocadiaceae bacterium B188]|nr:hypothetical protein B188_03650 [Candidatus Brocadiaceae bacterium B188]
MKDTLESDVSTANKQLEDFALMERIRWAVEAIGKDAVL